MNRSFPSLYVRFVRLSLWGRIANMLSNFLNSLQISNFSWILPLILFKYRTQPFSPYKSLDSFSLFTVLLFHKFAFFFQEKMWVCWIPCCFTLFQFEFLQDRISFHGEMFFFKHVLFDFAGVCRNWQISWQTMIKGLIATKLALFSSQMDPR